MVKPGGDFGGETGVIGNVSTDMRQARKPALWMRFGGQSQGGQIGAGGVVGRVSVPSFRGPRKSGTIAPRPASARLQIRMLPKHRGSRANKFRLAAEAVEAQATFRIGYFGIGKTRDDLAVIGADIGGENRGK